MVSFGSNRLGEKLDALTEAVARLGPGIEERHDCTHGALDAIAAALAERDGQILAAVTNAAEEGEHTCEVSQKLLTLVEGLVASQAALVTALTTLTEQMLTELQQTRNRTERTDGRAERLEFALEDLFTWLRALDRRATGGWAGEIPPLPPYPKTQAEIPNLDERRAQRDGRLALKGGG